MTQHFHVPVVQADLRIEESLMQLFDSLDYLDNLVNDVFGKIEKKVEAHRAKVISVNNRLNVAKAKVEKIVGSRKATQVFSSAKYPGPKKLNSFDILYGDTDESRVSRKNYNNVDRRIGRVDEVALREKQQFFRIELEVSRKRDREITEDEERCEGLGGLPKNIDSCSNLLLFNMKDNPYKKYVVMDPLVGATTVTRDDLEEQALKLANAPESLMGGEYYQTMVGDTYRYVPKMSHVPEISAPDVLTGLTGVADIHYTAELSNIAPSFELAGAVPDLPA